MRQDRSLKSAPVPPGRDAPSQSRRGSAAGPESRIIDFWAGVAGTQTPSGIWQDRLFAEAGSRLGTRDAAYASAQAALAQGLSDAFDECWKVKYRWWTARPSMVDPSLPLAMKNPPFPAYVSGHSTVSAAAAEILSVVVPSKTAVWRRDAAEARDSRLYAGIHFPRDNSAGFALGRSVGVAVAMRLALTSLETLP